MGFAIQLSDDEPTTVTVYCVQSYWRDRHKLAAGRFRQFKHEASAKAAGLSRSARDAGVLVYSVTGCLELDLWQEPKLLAKHGDVPEIQF